MDETEIQFKQRDLADLVPGLHQTSLAAGVGGWIKRERI